MCKNKFKGFSVLEVVISLVVVSIVLLALAPMIIKNVSFKNSKGVVFTYNGNTTDTNRCYVLKSGSTTQYETTMDCSKHVFVVPDGVDKVNLTLVAGGGGGGGAGGARLTSETLMVQGNDSYFKKNGASVPYPKYRSEYLKQIKINLLTAKGNNGSNANTGSGSSGGDNGYYGSGGGYYGSGSGSGSGYYGNQSYYNGYLHAYSDYYGSSNYYGSGSSSYYGSGSNYYGSGSNYYGSGSNYYGSGSSGYYGSGSGSNYYGSGSSGYYGSGSSGYYGSGSGSNYYGSGSSGYYGSGSSGYYGSGSSGYYGSGSSGYYGSGSSGYYGSGSGGSGYYGSGSGTTTNTSVTGTTGAGGKSAQVLVNYTIPKNFIKGVNFKETLNTYKEILLGHSYTYNNQSFYVDPPSGPRTYYSAFMSSINGSSRIPKDNIINSRDGGYARTVTCQKDRVNMKFPGGMGANASYYTSGAGGGGTGQGLICRYNSSTGCYFVTDSTNTKPGKNTVKVTVTQEIPPRSMGGGGAAGTVVRIMDLPVIPGNKYYVYVGKGGNGGRGGNVGSGGSTGTNGTEGYSGVSTAIYDSSGNLVYLVNGGKGGNGGTAQTSSGTTVVNSTPGASQPILVTNSRTQLENIKFDTTKSTFSTSIATPSASGFSGSVKVLPGVLRYPALFNGAMYKLNGANNGQIRGYSSFASGTTINNKTISGDSVYDGFYYKTLIDKDYNVAYVGGLGGFSGLGGKAGCGGYFMGNFDGRYGSGLTKRKYENKFIIGNASPYSNFSVSDYYDNCTIKSPNGQTAKFVKPNPSSLKFGQAGSGGGGGGYSISQGSGVGGKGQDGYVMIDWRKHK